MVAHPPQLPSLQQFTQFNQDSTSQQDHSNMSFELDTTKLTRSDSKMQPVVLLSCGSFNPPTIMHMRMFDLAKDALSQVGYNVLGGYMSPVANSYGKPNLAPAAHRVAMCHAAASHHPWVVCDPWEASQTTYTRTLAVLRRFKKELASWWEQGGRPHKKQTCGGVQESLQTSSTQQAAPSEGDLIHPPQMMLLCGADVLLSMLIPGVWEEPEQLIKEFGIVCIERNSILTNSTSNSSVDRQSGNVDQSSKLQEALDEQGGLLNRYKQYIHVITDPVPNAISSTAVRRELSAGRTIRYLVPDAVLDYLDQNTSLYRS